MKTIDIIKHTIKWILIGFFGSAVFEFNTSLMNKSSTIWFFTGVVLNIALFASMAYIFMKDCEKATKLTDKNK